MKSNAALLTLSFVLMAAFGASAQTQSSTIDVQSSVPSSSGASYSSTSEMSAEFSEFTPLGGWGLSYFNIATADSERVNTGGASWNIYQYLSGNYKFAADQRFAVRLPFTTKTAGVYNRFGNVTPLETTLDDMHIVYNNYALASFPWEWDLSGTFYAYAPTSKRSQDKKWITRLRAWFMFQKALDRNWTVSYNIKPEYFVNSQRAYRREINDTRADGSTFTSVRAENNQQAEVQHYLEINRYWNRYFTPSLEVGFNTTWYETSDEANYSDLIREQFMISPGTWIHFSRGFRIKIGVENQHNIRTPQKPFALFREEDNQYKLLTFWTIQ